MKRGDKFIHHGSEAEVMAQALGPSLPIEEIAQRLFALLDDCDTADDLAKGSNALYRHFVRRAHRARFKFATTDGYTVTFNTP